MVRPLPTIRLPTAPASPASVASRDTSASAAQAYVAAHPQFGVPTTWLIGGADPIADPTVSRTVAAAASPPAQIHFLDGLRHEVFNERERDRVFALLVAALPR